MNCPTCSNPMSSQPDDVLEKALKSSYLTITTISRDGPLQSAFHTWVDVNGQRFGVDFDKTAIKALLAEQVRLARIDELKKISWSELPDKAKDILWGIYIKDRLAELQPTNLTESKEQL